MRARVQIYSIEMENQWRIAVVACLVLFSMIEGAKRGRNRIGTRVKALEDRVKALEETCIDKCKR